MAMQKWSIAVLICNLMSLYTSFYLYKLCPGIVEPALRVQAES